MSGNLYPPLNINGDKKWPIKEYFNIISGANFLSAVKHLAHAKNFGTEEAFCEFNEANNQESTPNTSVIIRLGDDEFFFQLSEFFEELATACTLYIKLHPIDRDAINSILSISKF
jgi:hypothetical protein